MLLCVCVELFTCLWHCSYIQEIAYFMSVCKIIAFRGVIPFNFVGGDCCFGGKRGCVREKDKKVYNQMVICIL